MEKPDFDELVNRIGTHSSKWDALETVYNLDPADGIPMWVADMEFKAPESVRKALADMVAHGVYGYYGDKTSYHDAICGWMLRRHGWSVEPNTIFTTHGLVNGTALCIHAFTKPGDSVILFTPVYHAFARVIKAAGRDVLESRLVNNNGRYELDLDTLQAQLTGKETMLIFCSPHNPGGRVWTPAELVSVALFCEKNNLLLVSDEIQHDLVFECNTHTVMPNAAPDMMHRIVTMTAASKTFNLAGAHSGNVIISDSRLHKQFSDALMSYGISGNSFGLTLTEAAYNDGEDWLIQLIAYLDENRKVFDAGINAIPGLSSMPLQATYLAWVDFSGTGMSHDEIKSRVKNDARIATNDGPSFGSGGDFFQRFNLACPRAQVKEAVARMQRAFADIQ